MEVYLDNAATTKPISSLNILKDLPFGNPSSLHDLGLKSKSKIIHSKEVIRKYLNVKRNEIIFTSGATEANNLAIIGSALRNKNKRNKLITTKIEHKSVLNSFKYLQNLGFEVIYLDVDDKGIIDLEQLEKNLDDNTLLVSIMHINNETGAKQPIEKISKIVKRKNNKIIFHTDGVQSFTKYKINLKNIDLYTFSGHKIHGIKGVGGLYKSDSINLDSILKGGQQEYNIRPGTENLFGIIVLAEAVKKNIYNIEKNEKNVKKLKERMIKYLEENIENININSKDDRIFSNYILNISFKNILSEVLLHDLESKGIYISTGSACNSKSKSYSHVLEAIGLDEDKLKGSIRISFSKNNTIEQIDYACREIKKSVKDLRKIIR
ncbi:MAG: cysteine desulfurase family protein [Bacillota bacterium]